MFVVCFALPSLSPLDRCAQKRFDLSKGSSSLWKDISTLYIKRWANVFPVQWNALGAVCERFCEITKEHFKAMSEKGIPDVVRVAAARMAVVSRVLLAQRRRFRFE